MYSFLLAIGIVVGAGLIAYLGNLVGRRIGRSRLTLIKLRPRYTANLFTVFTGALIALSTMALLLLLSSDFRTAFFEWEKLAQARRQLTGELAEKNKQLDVLEQQITSLEDKAQKAAAEVKQLLAEKKILEEDVAKLKEIIAALLSDVQNVRSGQMVFKVNDPIIGAVLAGGQNNKEATQVLKNLLSRADSFVRGRAQAEGLAVPADKPLLWLANQELTEAADYLSRHPGQIGCRVVAAHNAVAGEVVVVHLELFANKLIYAAGQKLGEVELDPGLGRAKLESKIYDLLGQVGSQAREKGVLSTPEGLVGSLPYSRLYQLIEKISSSRKMQHLEILAVKDIYTVGPLEVDFSLEHSGH